MSDPSTAYFEERDALRLEMEKVHAMRLAEEQEAIKRVSSMAAAEVGACYGELLDMS